MNFKEFMAAYIQQIEEKEIRRTNLNSGLHTDLTLEDGIKEIAGKTAARTFDSRAEIVAALCHGEAIEVGVHSYKMLD